MKKITLGTPESITPSLFCKGFSYRESEIAYPVEQIEFEVNTRGCLIRLPLKKEERIYGLGLQLKAFDLRGRKFTIRPNADPIAPTGDSHAPVPFSSARAVTAFTWILHAMRNSISVAVSDWKRRLLRMKVE